MEQDKPIYSLEVGKQIVRNVDEYVGMDDGKSKGFIVMMKIGTDIPLERGQTSIGS